jgi:acetyltransferase-like isoleucine patch superfamily enzyme/fumarate reductase subunit D
MAMTPSYLLCLFIVDWDWLPYILTIAVVGEHLERACLVTLTVVFKWLLVGRVRPGSKGRHGSWSRMCHWVVETLIQRDSFKQALEGFINTEVLRLVFVLLGATIGRRASMDMISCRTPDLLYIGDYMLFGSKVGIVCDDEKSWKPVQMCRGANVLDNCVLCPGVTVGQRAILGTNTLAAPGQYFPPDTINTGNKGGQAVFLRKKGKGLASTAAMEADANRRLESPLVWTLFNVGLCLAALMEPVFRAVKTVPLLAAFLLAESWECGVAITMLLMLVEEFVEAAMLYVLKWTMIGRFRERDVPFFGMDHFLWMVWLMISCTFNHLDGFHGTVLYSAFLRAMGAQVGKDCTLFGFTLEFDLLYIGDRVNVGLDCDNTCHTVENMVLKMVPVKLGSYSTMQRHSFVMPGAELCEGAVLFEESQVLKGEVVPNNEIWAGNPAEPMKIRRGRLWDATRPPADHGSLHEEHVAVAVAQDECNSLKAPLLPK